MGKSSTFTETTATHNCVEKKKRRRLHPVRRIARLLLGGSKSKREGRDTTSADGDNHETEGKTCYGASRWQNVLPFLEPLIALDPKLSFIEDRILKRPTPTTSEKVRQQQHKPEPPRTLRHLQQRVQDEDVFCNCDECAPKYYKISTTASHGTIRDLPPQDSQSTTSTKKTRSFQTPLQLKTPTPILPTLTLRFHGGTYEAMTLVRHHIAWLDATYLHPSASPTVAVKKLRTLLTAWHPHLSSANLRHTLSTHQLATLFSHLNAVFFAGCVPPHNKTLSAGFSYLSEACSDSFGRSNFNRVLGTQVLLHPCLWRGQHSHTHGHRTSTSTTTTAAAAVSSRLSTLLHEMSHAYLQAYTCAACPTHASSIGPLGHGRAWQLLAAKIEHVASVLLGTGMDLGRLPALLRDVGAGAALPSWHDLGVWGMLAGEKEKERRELGREDSGVGGLVGLGGERVVRSRGGVGSRGKSRAGSSKSGDGRLWWLMDEKAEGSEIARRSVRLVFDNEDG
ncbi:hypothetical protein PtrSN002B_003512 [Pyrenophora tritici-repentis]|uniref:Uncharacterized protein n=1 Tax=Pyrenophora tritici-repentis TaxID=45151 RepID=A0A2W1H6K3_9PLEO|nr:hypothetical protein A1F99_085330 [Pyrenophora tritici-repentis]KAI1510828.1 hypothetical protein Ptr86124_009949 [Pyrenophora tritici-repentis]KAI1554945.1 hypothetical protein PtrSN002B_003512 [Pyrenophora tritici-repentis]KAI1668421.1 hypothetical protein L13192_07557 [Pyrenophora tritici-repentis]KAI1680830.1 hypothetical protein KJE20_09681 [Pyrenophora tritici-repentis]